MTASTEANAEVERVRKVVSGLARNCASLHPETAAYNDGWTDALAAVLSALAQADQPSAAAIPAGMVPYGPEHTDYPNEPSDFDRNRATARRDGKACLGVHAYWKHIGLTAGSDIVAYTPTQPTTEAAAIPAVTQAQRDERARQYGEQHRGERDAFDVMHEIKAGEWDAQIARTVQPTTEAGSTVAAGECLGCEYDDSGGGTYTVTWPDGMFLVADVHQNIFVGRSPRGNGPVCVRHSLVALAAPASQDEVARLREALENLHTRIADAWPELANLPPMIAARAALDTPVQQHGGDQ